MRVLYKSHAGHAKRYAEMIAAALGCECAPVEEATKKERIVYVGSVFGDRIEGYKKVRRKCDVVAVAAVGINPATTTVKQRIVVSNKIDEDKLFVLIGGFDASKLNGFRKRFACAMKKSAKKMFDSLKNPTPEDRYYFDILVNGCDYVCEENAAQIIEYVKKAQGLEYNENALNSAPLQEEADYDSILNSAKKQEGENESDAQNDKTL